MTNKKGLLLAAGAVLAFQAQAIAMGHSRACSVEATTCRPMKWSSAASGYPSFLAAQLVASAALPGSTKGSQPAAPIVGTVYARNTQRAVTPAGPSGPLGDQVVASGVLYASPDDSRPIGIFDLVAFTTSVQGQYERRQVFIELSIDNEYIQGSWLSGLSLDASQNTGRSDLNLMGVETYPTGGGILVQPLQLGLSAGTGAFLHADGFARITYDPAGKLFSYNVSIFNRDH